MKRKNASVRYRPIADIHDDVQSEPMSAGPLLAGVALAGLTIWMLLTGSAGTSRDMWRRDDEPLVYWAVIGIGVLASGALLMFGFTR